jgi:hypothetical protein
MSFKIKAFIVVLAILIIAYVFGGCGRTDTAAPATDGTTTQEVQPQQ